MTSRVIEAPIVIIVSLTDLAGLNMKNHLLNLLEFEKVDFLQLPEWPAGKYELLQNQKAMILTIPIEPIFADFLKGHIKSNLVIFASKHSSSAAKKSLLVHTTGIWGKESGHGGYDHQLSFAPSLALREAYFKIKKYQEKAGLNDYLTTIEATHHGPSSLDIPVIFLETGGTEKEWGDIAACNLIAEVIKDIIDLYQDEVIGDDIAFIGLGGGHYCPSFIKKLEKHSYQIGHVAPKYVHEFVNEELLVQAYEKTIAREKIFLIDKKGSKSIYRRKFIEIIEKNGWTWEYTSK